MAAHHAATAAGSPGTGDGGREPKTRCRPPGPRRSAGPAEGAASPGKPISTRIDYGTESVVISHTTSARAQCKSLAGRSSCGIVAAGQGTPEIRTSEAVP